MRAVLLVLMLVAGLVCVPASGVHAADGLFDPDVTWVPGDERTASVTVRNRHPEAALLTVAVFSTDPDRLARHRDITVAVRRPGTDWTTVALDGRPHRIGPRMLAGGATTRLEVRARFDADSPDRSQRSSLLLDLRVGLSQVAGPNSGDGLLPSTGGVRAALVVAGAFLLGGGLAFLILFRRKDLDDQP